MELLGTDFMPATFDLSVLKGAAGGAGRFDGRLAAGARAGRRREAARFRRALRRAVPTGGLFSCFQGGS